MQIYLLLDFCLLETSYFSIVWAYKGIKFAHIKNNYNMIFVSWIETNLPLPNVNVVLMSF